MESAFIVAAEDYPVDMRKFPPPTWSAPDADGKVYGRFRTPIVVPRLVEDAARDLGFSSHTVIDDGWLPISAGLGEQEEREKAEASYYCAALEVENENDDDAVGRVKWESADANQTLDCMAVDELYSIHSDDSMLRDSDSDESSEHDSSPSTNDSSHVSVFSWASTDAVFEYYI
jgi:hypothetical protein